MKQLRSLRAMTVFLTASLLAWGSTASAQQGPDTGSHVADQTTVWKLNEGPLRAAVRRAGARLAEASALGPQTSWIARHPVILGTSIGAGAGVALAAIDDSNNDAVPVLLGAGAGAWGGLIASAVQKARAKEKVGVGTKIGIAAGAIGLAVLPILACYGAGGCGGSS